MSINIGDKPEMNVVNVGDEISTDQLAAITGAASPSGSNVFATMADVGGNPFDQSLNTGDDATFLSVNFGVVGSGTIDQTGITFPLDGSVQTTAFIPADYLTASNISSTYLTQASASSTYLTQASASSTYLTQASASSTYLTRTNTFNTADTAVRITQEGTGEAFRIEDSTNPDTTPFVINASGQVGIGTTTLSSNALTVSGTALFNGFLNTSSINSFNLNAGTSNHFTVNNGGTGSAVVINHNNAASTNDAFRITNLGTGNSFVVEDDTNPDSTPFLISASGDVAIGSSTPNGKFRVTGRSYFENTSGSGGNAVLWARSTVATSVAVGQFTSDSAHTGTTLLVSNQGTGNSFVVEDSASDTTTFVIDNAGNVTLGGSLTLAAGAYAANAALVIDNTNYPHELEFKVGATTYRVPARAI